MPVILAIISAIAAAAFWFYRIKAAGEMAADIVDAANDVRLAARRFGYKRKNNKHTVDSIDDARLAAAGILIAIAEMDSALTQNEIDAAVIQCQLTFNTDQKDAEEIVTFGRWAYSQCSSKDEAVRRMSKRIQTLSGNEAGPDIIKMATAVATADGAVLGERENDAFATIKRVFDL